MHQLMIKPAIDIAGRKILTAIILLFLSTLTFSVKSEAIKPNTLSPKLGNETLNIKPEQCVAMLQGQACYVTVEINWQTSLMGDYCLYSSMSEGPLECWTKQSSGNFKQEFVATINIEFFLRQKNSQGALATSVLKMAWVHKKKGKPRMSWRMF